MRLRLPIGRAAHPRISSPLAIRLSGWKLPSVVLAYLGLVLAWVALSFVFLALTENGRHGVGDLVRQAFWAMYGPDNLLGREGESIAFYVFAVANALVSVLLPVFVLGAFVFKLFHQDPLVWRSGLSLEAHPMGDFVLSARFYNGLKVPLADVSVRAWLRWIPSETPTVHRNRQLKIFLRGGLVDTVSFPLAMTAEPTTLRIPLGPTSRAGDPIGDGCIRIQGETIDTSTAQLVLIAEGLLPSTNEQFRSFYQYDLGRPIDQELFQDISSGAAPSREWENFDGVQQAYVFVYGSLMREADLRAAGLAAHDHMPATLLGWRRRWNVASDPVRKGRRYRLADGSHFEGRIVSVGLARADGASVRGVLVKVGPRVLADFDIREQDYVRTDVTASIDACSTLPSVPFRVFTYVPTTEAVAELERRLGDGSLAVATSYFTSVRQAAEEIGGPLDDFEEAALRGIAVVDMKRDEDPAADV